MLAESRKKILGMKKQLERDEKRIAELKRLFMKIYEDNTRRLLNDVLYDLLSQSYEAEQRQLESESATLRRKIEVQEQKTDSIDRFIQKAKTHIGIEELDAYTLHELIQGICVDVPDKSSGKRQSRLLTYPFHTPTESRL